MRERAGRSHREPELIDPTRGTPFVLASADFRLDVDKKLLHIQQDHDPDSMKDNNFVLLAELAGIDLGPAHNFLALDVPISAAAFEAIEKWFDGK